MPSKEKRDDLWIVQCPQCKRLHRSNRSDYWQLCEREDCYPSGPKVITEKKGSKE